MSSASGRHRPHWMRIGGPVLTVGLVVIVMTVGVAPVGATGQPSSPDSRSIAADRRGPTFVATEPTAQAAERIGRLIESAPRRYTGVIVTGENTLTVTLPAGVDPAAREQAVRAVISGGAPAAPVSVTFVTVPRSRSDIQAIQARLRPILAAGVYAGQFIGFGQDQSLGVVVVYVNGSSTSVRNALASQFGDAIIFRGLGPAQLTELDRSRDSVPHFAGSGFLAWNDAHTAYVERCSSGFTVTVSGVSYELTAGHCLPGSSPWTNLWASAFTSTTPPASYYYFGTRHTTTAAGTDPEHLVEGTQDRYGDWALIRSASYGTYVYNCTNGPPATDIVGMTGSCTALAVGAASYVAPALNTGACTSGSTTGQICRFFVSDSDATVNFGGLLYNHLTLMNHDGDLDGNPDCGTTLAGDSGGAVYQAISGRTGYVRAMGTVTGITGCTDVYTRLDGLRAWNSTASVTLHP
jgi:hypothetical protein